MSSTGVTDQWEIVVWEIDDNRVRATLRHDDLRRAVLAWSPDASRLAVATRHGPLTLWDPTTGDTTTLTCHVDSVTGVVWSPDGRHIVTTGENGAVTVQRVDDTFSSRLQLAGANCIAWADSTIVVGQRTGPAVLELRTFGG
jgi:WD40 repeat protein